MRHDGDKPTEMTVAEPADDEARRRQAYCND